MKARVHPDQISDHATSLSEISHSTIRVPAPSLQQITGTVGNAKRETETQKVAVSPHTKLFPNQADLSAPCARGLRSRGSSSKKATEQHPRQSGSSCVAEHHPEKKNGKNKKGGGNSHRSRISRTTNTQHATRSSRTALLTARKIFFKKKSGTLTSWRGAGFCARRNGVVGGTADAAVDRAKQRGDVL